MVPGVTALTAPLDRLATALADRYRLERELGAGGMAMVYLAQDLMHDRKVAIKVLRPELGASLGPERFLQEIATTIRWRLESKPVRHTTASLEPRTRPGVAGNPTICGVQHNQSMGPRELRLLRAEPSAIFPGLA
jgi:hypothetical protein